jgi:hypothetical protein
MPHRPEPIAKKEVPAAPRVVGADGALERDGESGVAEIPEGRRRPADPVEESGGGGDTAAGESDWHRLAW